MSKKAPGSNAATPVIPAASAKPAKPAAKKKAAKAAPVLTSVPTPVPTPVSAAVKKARAVSKPAEPVLTPVPSPVGAAVKKTATAAKATKPAKLALAPEPLVTKTTPTKSTPTKTAKTTTAKTPPAKRKKPATAEKLPPATPVSAAAPKPGSKLEKNLASRPAASLTAPVRIFQIYFEAWQKELLDPAFAPLNNAGSTSETLEFDVFERLARSEYVKGATLWGALSWRFAEKTGMGGNDMVKAITAAPGMDVYYCNPHPQNEALFHNMWTQGETTHPRFLALSRALFQAVGLPEEELASIEASGRYSAANYFVGTPAFWSKYLPFVRKVLATADKKLSPDARKLLHSTMADDRGLHRGATYVPFIVERLFPLFLKSEGRGLKAHKIALPEREREMNVHLKLLREMKDVAHRTKSPWLAACWVNYRNLYLSQVNGKAWCQKYLRAVTPTEIKFG
jgi:hypothetical protein